MFPLRSSSYFSREHNILSLPKPSTTSYGINFFSHVAEKSRYFLPDHHSTISDFIYFRRLMAELAERSPIIIQNISNPSNRKNLDVRPYDRATFNMHGQLYRGHANATALFSSPVVSALGSESDDPGSCPGRGKALCP